MKSAETIINEAISIINAFVDGTSEGTVTLSPAGFHELSYCIERAKSARIAHPHLSTPDRAFSALCARYQLSLEKLQIRLREIEAGLNGERNRLLDHELHLARAREWHTSLNRTQ